MRFIQRMREFAQTKGWRREQAELWAAQYYPGAGHVVAATTARIVVEQLGVSFEQLSPVTRFFQDLRMDDPLEGVELLMAVEEEFGFRVPDEDARALETPRALVTYLHERVPTHGA